MSTLVINGMDDKDWEGDERREIKRRYTIDRRVLERRKRYWSSLLLPILIGTVATSIIAWGAYVTHITYGISAKYEQSFVKHVNEQLTKDALNEHRLEMIQSEHNLRMTSLRNDMNTGFKEMREFQHDIYNLILNKKVDKKVEKKVDEEP